MIIEKSTIKRLGIFFFYDKDGIADRYVDYFVNEYHLCHDKLIIVCNGDITKETKDMFLQYTKNVIVRENKGLDVAAYLTAFQSLGWSELETYDEVSIANFTLMGPVAPLLTMYQRMEKEDVDFWGISKHYKFDYDASGKISYGYIPEHIQSHYMVFRSSLVKSKQFQNFWDNMPQIEDYKDSVALFEATFTKRFSDYGFKWGISTDFSGYEGISYNPIMEYPRELIEKRNCLLFKRRSFFQDPLVVYNTTAGEPAIDLFDFLDKKTKYDTSLIMENIIRSCNHADFSKALQLNEIVDTEQEKDALCEEELKDFKVVLIMHLTHRELTENALMYAKYMPDQTSVVIMHNKNDKDYYAEVFKEIHNIQYIETNGKTESENFAKAYTIISDYDVCCYYHDIIGDVQKNSFYKRNADNILYNDVYIKNIINLFRKNRYLGMLVPFEPYHGDYFPTLGREWKTCYEQVEKIVKKLGMIVPISKEKEPITSSNYFMWFRVDALNALDSEVLPSIQMEKMEDEEEILERILPFLCLNNGYYPSYLESDYYTKIELTALRHYMREYGKYFEKKGVSNGQQWLMFNELDAKMNGGVGAQISVEGMKKYIKVAGVLQRILPQKIYSFLIRIKRKLFGPYDLV